MVRLCARSAREVAAGVDDRGRCCSGLTLAVETSGGAWRLVGRLRVPRRRVALGGGVLPAAVAPLPFLTETAGEWHLEEEFPNREALVGAIGSAAPRLVEDLREAAGDRWPSPPRKRR